MMSTKKIVILVLIALSTITFIAPKGILRLEADSPNNILHVDPTGNSDFLSIQHAINEAQPYDTIYIHDGLYYENIFIDKPLTLQGEHTGKVIIDGNQHQSVINITADDVVITTLTIRNSSQGIDAGIKVYSSSIINITNCDIYSNYYGIWFFQSNNNVVTQCTIHENYYGILVQSLSTYNSIQYCHVNNNDNTGIHLCCSSRHNIIHNCDVISNTKIGVDVGVTDTTIYLNNFIDNGINARSKYENQWDYETKGNYWSDYDEKEEGASDNDGDGFADLPYTIPEEDHDRYPFINQIGQEEQTHDTPGFLFYGVFLASLIGFLAKKHQ